MPRDHDSISLPSTDDEQPQSKRRRLSVSPSVDSAIQRHREEEHTEDDDDSASQTTASQTTEATQTTATTTTTTATYDTTNPESIFLAFIESRFNELGRKQENLLKKEHELVVREKALELQLAQIHYQNGYIRGIMSNNIRGSGRGIRGGRGFRGGSRSWHAPATGTEE